MIQVSDLYKNFGKNRVLRGISLTINTGESIAIIGRSGCGKSVLLKHIIGLMRPDSGEVIVDGKSLNRLSERELLDVRRRFGMVFQGAALFDSLTVEENVGFVLFRERKLPVHEIKKRVSEALEMVDLPGIQDKMPSELSGGMKKRVGLARALVYKPEFILYDEPTTGLDPIVADSIDKLMMKVWEELKITSITVTHDMRTARRLGKRIFMMHDGRIHFSGSADELFGSSDPIVRKFVNGISETKEDIS
jgi:phospholipid/cholesterol/gamma-HCH transport system ATP-binding protein